MASALRSITLRRLAIATVVVMGAGYALAFLYAPEDADQGFIQKIFYLHVPLATVALRRLHRRRDPRDPPPAHRRPQARRPLLRLDPHLGDLRRRRAAHRRDLGEGLLGRLVGVAGADAGQLPDRLPALRDLLPAALRDRGSRAPGPLRVRLRDHRRRLRPAQLPGRARSPSRWSIPAPSRRRRPARTRCCSPSSSAWPAWRCSGRPWSGSSSTPRRASGNLKRIRRAGWRRRRDPARDRERRPLRRRRLSRLPPAAADLRGDHGREAPAHPAGARLARRPRRPPARDGARTATSEQIRGREQEIEAVRQGDRG